MKNHSDKIKALIAACDRIWRRLVITAAGGKCEICGLSNGYQEVDGEGKIVWVQACHIISRSFWSTRWTLKNGVAGCQDCHDDEIIMAWLKRTDRRRYNWIVRKKREIVPHREIDLEKVLVKLLAA